MSAPTVSTDVSVLLTRAQAAYARCIDDGPLDDWPNFFTENCHYRITTAKNYRNDMPIGMIWADTRRMLLDRVSALRDANIYERHTYRHVLGLPMVLADDGAVISSETPFIVVRIVGEGLTSVYASGRYVDEYVRDGDEAKLRSRIVVCDSSHIDTLLALPL